MLHPGEVTQTLTYHLFLDTRDIGCYPGSKTVVDVMLSGETQALLLHIERCGFFYLIFAFFDISDTTLLLEFGEWILHSLYIVFLQFSADDWVVVPIDERVLWSLVLDNTHFRIHIVLHAVAIS